MQVLDIEMNGVSFMKVDIASNWDELTKDEALFIAGNWEAWKALELMDESLVKAKGLLFYNMLRLPAFKKVKAMEELAKLSNEEQHKRLRMIDWAMTDIKLTKQHLPLIKVSGVEFTGFDDMIGNMLMDDYVRADKAFIDYLNTGTMESLDELMEALYKPNKPTKLNGPGSEMSYDEKQLALLYYRCCREELMDYMGASKSESNSSTIEQSDWLNLELEMANVGTFGPFERVEQTNVWVFFKEFKKQMERSTAK